MREAHVGEYVSVQVTGGLATIQLDRPPMNVLNFQVQVSCGRLPTSWA